MKQLQLRLKDARAWTAHRKEARRRLIRMLWNREMRKEWVA